MPPTGNVLLDTSIVIPYLKGDATVHQQMQAVSAICVPVTVAGELYCGAYASNHQARLLQEIKNFLCGVTLLFHSDFTAEIYGKIRAELAKAGTPIPENDIWIAAIAKEQSLPLATRDAHFQRINGLNLANW